MHTEILLVESDPAVSQLLRGILSDVGQLHVVTNADEALRLVCELHLDLVLLDLDAAEPNGLELCAALKAEPLFGNAPVLGIGANPGEAFIGSGLAIGIADFVTKPINSALLLARVRTHLQLKRLSDELRRTATVDVLTGVANRRRFDEGLEMEWLRALRTCEPLALVMIDLDCFEQFNHSYGEAAGDQCLQAVAQVQARACRRPGDVVARYAGNKFALLLPHTSAHGAQHLTQRILEAIQALNIAHAASSCATYVTASAGIAWYQKTQAQAAAESQLEYELRVRFSARSLVEAADRALYSAKDAGRARACLLNIAGDALFEL